MESVEDEIGTGRAALAELEVAVIGVLSVVVAGVEVSEVEAVGVEVPSASVVEDGPGRDIVLIVSSRRL